MTTQEVVQGQPDGSVCEFSFTGSIPAGGVEGDEVAFNPSTCQAKYAIGPVQQPGPSSGLNEAAASGGGNSTASSAAVAGDPAKAFYLKSYWEDPVGIDVTSLRNDVDWHYTLGASVNSYKWKRNANWYSTSGWQLANVADDPSLSKTKAVSDSFAKMTNSVFCYPYPTTYTTYHWDHIAWGGYWGVGHYGFQDEVGGGCDKELSHHYVAKYETPWY